MMSMQLFQFNRVVFPVVVCLVLLTIVPCPAEIMEISSSENVRGSLVTVTNLTGWTLELVGVGQDRELKTMDGERLQFESLRRSVRAGYSPLPWLQLQLGLGMAKPQSDGVHGEDGFDYSGRARVSFVDYVLESSVIYGTTHSVSLQSELSYSHADAQLSDMDFEWSEFSLAPYAQYKVDYRDAKNWNHFDPRSTDLKAGLLFSAVDASWGGEDLNESRDFGWMAGGDVHLGSDVVFGLAAYVMHSDEVTTELSLGYRF
jgi:hypothetical protein